MKNSIVLVVPNYRWGDIDDITYWHYIPYNLCLIASMIREVYDVQIVDANIDNLTEEDLFEIISKINPKVVGISVLMDKYGLTGHAVAKIAKSVNKEITTVIGGVYASTNSKEVIKDKNLDYLVKGEGEYCFKELLDFINGDKKDIPKGIWYKDQEKVIDGGRSDLITDLDKLPLPSYDLINFLQYANNVERNSVDRPSDLPYTRILTSRGCNQKCVFCQVEEISGLRYRGRSANNVLNEIDWIKKTYGIKSFILDDDNFLSNRKRAKELFEGLIERKINLPWKAPGVAAFLLDNELIELMKKSGCEYINIAVESGSERVLKEIINKPVTKQKIIEVVNLAKKNDIFVVANFVIGFPGETWDEIRETLKFAEEIDVDYVKIFNAIPLNNTKLYTLAKETNALLPGFDSGIVDWKHGWIETEDFKANDTSILRGYEWDRINFTDPVKRKKIAKMMDITEEELLMIRRRTLETLALR